MDISPRGRGDAGDEGAETRSRVGVKRGDACVRGGIRVMRLCGVEKARRERERERERERLTETRAFSVLIRRETTTTTCL